MSYNPLDWPATPFLWLYALLTIAAFLVAIRWRSQIAPAQPSRPLPDPDAMQLAYLAGGPDRVMDTALVALLSTGAATADSRTTTLGISSETNDLPLGFHRIRGLVSGEMDRRQAHNSLQPAVAQLRDELVQHGLAPAPAAITAWRRDCLGLLAIPIVLGLLKLAVGLSRDRPVGILEFLLCVTALAAFVLLVPPPLRTRAGAALLDESRTRHARAARAPLQPELALAFALAGAAVLEGTPHAWLAREIRNSSATGCGGGGDGGGGGCGGCSA